ncbi:RidA family protein [Sphingobacterium rhinopitheci]|uniref:RidA family protein n=1 Tax=Sphingobacterium rhinopitheci TaxID=2781960 RepID=UPI001F524F2B|nr:RidA family protein [Sphingobacterium rhinopitheci]MCI0920504.1 RidA family protein [Sphingobacterium rhinopitheci]
MAQKEILNTKNAPAAIGPYNQAVKADKTLYVSGQIPLIPETMELVETGVIDETHQVLKNVNAILENAGYTFNDVVKASIFLSDMGNFAAVNEVYAQYFTENQPARECVAVKTLPKNVNVEISVIAWKG